MNGHDIERVIDEAARSLTAGEPGAAFRANVIDRVVSCRAPRRARRPLGILLPASAVAIVIVALWIARDRRDAGVSAPPQTASFRPDVTLPQLAVRRPNAAPARSRDVPSPIAALKGPRYSINSAPLSELDPAPLTVPSIAMRRIDPGESIQLDRLQAIAPLAISRLDDSQGDRP
jgi:hypothetical protein